MARHDRTVVPCTNVAESSSAVPWHVVRALYCAKNTEIVRYLHVYLWISLLLEHMLILVFLFFCNL